MEGDYVSDSEGVRLDLYQQVEMAHSAGVEWMVASACNLGEVQALRERAGQFRSPELSRLRWAVAIHPNDAPRHQGILDTGPDNVTQKRAEYEYTPLDQALETVARAAQELDFVVAIGESGLDYFRTAPRGREVQKEAFTAHIELAKSLDMPLQIHDREAHADCIEVLERCGAPRRTVFHCFSGDAEMAGILAEHGWYASFAGNVTYAANQDLQAGARVLPAELILSETDAPYLTPLPYRGRPNASYLVGLTTDFLAELRGVESEKWREQVRANSAAVYGL